MGSGCNRPCVSDDYCANPIVVANSPLVAPSPTCSPDCPRWSALIDSS